MCLRVYRLSPLLITFFESCVREPTSTIPQPSCRRSRGGSEADLPLTYNPCLAADEGEGEEEEEAKGSVEGKYSYNNNATIGQVHKRHMNGAINNNHDSIGYSRL